MATAARILSRTLAPRRPPPPAPGGGTPPPPPPGGGGGSPPSPPTAAPSRLGRLFTSAYVRDVWALAAVAAAIYSASDARAAARAAETAAADAAADAKGMEAALVAAAPALVAALPSPGGRAAPREEQVRVVEEWVRETVSGKGGAAPDGSTGADAPKPVAMV